eukprot:SAG11_NODE_2372_length_3446_cov_9.306543_4_plen_45_part_00
MINAAWHMNELHKQICSNTICSLLLVCATEGLERASLRTGRAHT